MIPNIHQSIDEIIKASSAEQRVLWQQIRLLTGENASIRQFFYMGVIAGSEYLTYTAGKLYLVNKLAVSNGIAAGATQPYARVYDETNTISMYINNIFTVWNVTAAAIWYVGNNAELTNLYFSRIEVSVYTNILLSGYKIG